VTTKRTSIPRGDPDYVLIMIIATLLALGLLMVYSASYALAVDGGLPPAHYFWRQSAWAALGIVGLLIMYRMDTSFWQRWAIPIMALTLLVLLAVLLIGDQRFGAKRTLLHGHVQPSEAAKLTLILYVATWLASKGSKLQKASYGLIPFACLIGLAAGLVALEPDLSTALLIVVVGLVMFFLAGADLKQLAISLGASSASFALLILGSGYGKARVREFARVVRDPLMRGSTETFTRGGPIGLGLGAGSGRWGGGALLPHTDGVFAVLGEESGIIGSLIVVALFAAFAYRGFRIAGSAPDKYTMLVAAGITVWLVAQALVHIAVTVALSPVTGMTLPFISYGGSSLVVCLAGVGLLLNVSRGTGGARREEAMRSEALDFRRRDRRARLSTPGRRGSARGRRGGSARSGRGSRTGRPSNRSASRRRKKAERSLRWQPR
jgi:cell division protein FtsW